MLPLTEKEKTSYKEQQFCHICKKEFNDEFNGNENYCKVRDHCHYTEKYRDDAHSICYQRYKTPK